MIYNENQLLLQSKLREQPPRPFMGYMLNSIIDAHKQSTNADECPYKYERFHGRPTKIKRLQRDMYNQWMRECFRVKCHYIPREL